jgi:hypothetical protein
VTRHRLAGWLAAVSVAGCAPVHVRTDLSVEAARIASRTAADAYGGPEVDAGWNDDVRQLAAFLLQSMAPEVRALVRHEPALDGVAEAIATMWLDGAERPAYHLSQWLVSNAGSAARFASVLPGRAIMVGKGSCADRAWFAEAVERYGQGIKTEKEPLVFGVSRFDRTKHCAYAVVTAFRPIRLDPIAKVLPAGGIFRVKGSATTGATGLKLCLAGSGVGNSCATVRVGPDDRFEAELTAPDAPGTFVLEISTSGAVAEGWRRGRLVALPFRVGAPEPGLYGAVLDGWKAPEDEADWPAFVADAVDAERARLSLPPLRRLPSEVAARVQSIVAGAPEARDTRIAEELRKNGIEAGGVHSDTGSEPDPRAAAWRLTRLPSLRAVALAENAFLAVTFARRERGYSRYLVLLGEAVQKKRDGTPGSLATTLLDQHQ